MTKFELQSLLNGEEDGDDNQQNQLYEEQQKRHQAEANRDTLKRQLQVLQEQFSEYVLEESQKLTNALNLADDSSQQQQLKEELRSIALEAQATAAQIKSETDRLTKRPNTKTPSGSRGNKNDMPKRLKEDGDNNKEEDDDDEQATDSDMDIDAPPSTTTEPTSSSSSSEYNPKERAKYVPMRLTRGERRLLRLLEGALQVNEYTDKVDILNWRSRTGRIQAQIKDVCAILCGLAVAQDFRQGQQLIENKEFDQLAPFFQECFEVGRRYKIQNPEKMRETYGKLMYLLQDSQDEHIAELLGFRCVVKLKTVHAKLEEGGGLGLLDEPALPLAIAEIDPRGLSRSDIQKKIKLKERARDGLAKKYANKVKECSLEEEDLLQCIYSLGDENSYLSFNRDPVDRMISLLQKYFSPDKPGDEASSLAISGGQEGARLSHSHSRQYAYVIQSLSLWREISNEMFKLWYLSEMDLLSTTHGYRLTNTGQGLNRVQSAPCVSNAMHRILSKCQQKVGSWVGSSVIHLGDHNVPNSLMFIDKYTQVPRILNPIVAVVEELPKVCNKDKAVAAYVKSTFGGVEACVKEILRDFFRHGFDGSGADNFFDAGSCIDGRLTSSWQWCSKIEKKRYYSVFKLCGFTSFDGDYKGQ